MMVKTQFFRDYKALFDINCLSKDSGMIVSLFGKFGNSFSSDNVYVCF